MKRWIYQHYDQEDVRIVKYTFKCGDGGYQIKVEEHNEKVTKQLHP